MTSTPVNFATAFYSHEFLIKIVNVLDVSKANSVPVAQEMAILRQRPYFGLSHALA
jgi:hypothetical protein